MKSRHKWRSVLWLRLLLMRPVNYMKAIGIHAMAETLDKAVSHIGVTEACFGISAFPPWKVTQIQHGDMHSDWPRLTCDSQALTKPKAQHMFRESKLILSIGLVISNLNQAKCSQIWEDWRMLRHDLRLDLWCHAPNLSPRKPPSADCMPLWLAWGKKNQHRDI